jgi:uncharacterized protein YndB with AHSA1/START domain
MKAEPFVIERTYNAPLEKVWSAITDKDKMKQWYFDLADFKPEVGFEFQFEGGAEDRVYLHHCKITEVIPNKKLTYSWRYEGYAGNSFVTWELFEEGKNKTRLKLTHEGLETFPRDNPDFAKQNFVNGWTEIVGTSLEQFVEVASIKFTVAVNASPIKMWDVLVNPAYSKQWAKEFSEGALVKTDWKEGSEVLWLTKSGDIGAKGVVLINKPACLLKIGFYDDIKMTPPSLPGEYSETYSLAEQNGQTIFSLEGGPLPVKEYSTHLPLWKKAVEKMKALAEEEI